MTLRKILVVILLPLFLSGIYAYFFRSLYSSSFDREYYNDLYDHSQYSIAQSIRQMGDGGVYQTIGDRLVRGKVGVFTVDPQVPPLGKVFIGLSINIFGNGYVVNIVTGAFSAWALFLITYSLTASYRKSMIALTLFLVDPLIVSQYKQTMLDLPQLTMMLWHIALILIALRNKNATFRAGILCIAGVFIGLFASIKFGLIAPILIAVDFLFIWNANRARASTFVKSLYSIVLPASMLMLGVIIGFFIGHLQFFLEGGALLQFLKNEKWVLTFWLNGNKNISAFIGMPIITLVLGMYRHFTKTASWEFVEGWNLLWPLYLVGLFLVLRKMYTHKVQVSLPLRYLSVLVVSILMLYTILPFYYRYLVLVVPLLIVIFISEYSKYGRRQYVVFGVIGIYLLVKLTLIFFELPSEVITDTQRYFKNWTLQDLYPGLLNVKESRREFWERTYEYKYGSQATTSLIIHPAIAMPWQTRIVTPYTLTYDTMAGRLRVNGTMEFVRVNHAWHLMWKDTYLHSQYAPGDKLILTLGLLPRGGKVIRKDGGVYMGPSEIFYARLYPDRIKAENTVVEQLMTLTGQSRFGVENLYKSNHVSRLPVVIGKIQSSFVRNIPRIKLDNAIEIFSKVEYPYVPPQYDAIRPIESRDLSLIKANGNTITLLSVPPREGVDIIQ